MDESEPDINIQEVSAVEAVGAASALFDHPLDLPATEAFLADDRHHLLIGYIGLRPAGFATAVELLHPDKRQPEMFLYELGVGEEFRRRGVATALMTRLVALCRERGCGEMFVLSDADNVAAAATYRGAGGEPAPPGVMFQWDWRWDSGR